MLRYVSMTILISLNCGHEPFPPLCLLAYQPLVELSLPVQKWHVTYQKIHYGPSSTDRKPQRVQRLPPVRHDVPPQTVMLLITSTHLDTILLIFL
jgi:hypothetical protein